MTSEIKPIEYWLQQRWGKLTLAPNQKLPEEWSHGNDAKFLFTCDCSNTSCLPFYSIKKTRSCGCSRIGEGVDSEEREVRDFIKSLYPDTYPTAYPLPGTRKSYDIYVPSKRFAVEYHGLIWHSDKFTQGLKDHDKYLVAQSRGDRLIQIYSDEWKNKKDIFKEMLRVQLKCRKIS